MNDKEVNNSEQVRQLTLRVMALEEIVSATLAETGLRERVWARITAARGAGVGLYPKQNLEAFAAVQRGILDLHKDGTTG